MDTIHIALTFDDSCIEQSVVLMTSVLVNKGDESIHFHIIDGGICEKNKKLLFDIKNCEITFHFINNKLFENCIISKNKHLYDLYKVVLPVVLNLDKVIFLASDLIVKSSLVDLWWQDISDKYIAAVEHAEGKILLKKSGLKLRSRFFSTDVMLINCKKWIEDNIPARAIDLLKNKFNSEQFALNFLFHGHIQILSLKWNLQFCPIIIWPTYYSMDKYLEAIEKPYIINFSDEFKPFLIGIGFFNPNQDEYYKYQKLTSLAFADYRARLLTDKLLSLRGILLFIIKRPLFFINKYFWKTMQWVFKNYYFLFHYQFE